MENVSQSRHFSLQWLDRPATWLERLHTLIPQDPILAWRWHVSHHQLLTLAKRSEREVGLSILWFAVNDMTQSPASPIVAGALLPGDRLVVIAPSKTSPRGPLSENEIPALQDFLKARFKIKTLLATDEELKNLGFMMGAESVRELERQTPWGKRLTNVATDFDNSKRPNLTVTRRAVETDRPLLNRWARGFALDTRSDANDTTIEASEWMKRGRLLIFETDRPVGMAALSGEFTDPDFGRTCRLSLIYVDPVYRGRGLGHELVAAIESEARLESANALILYSDPENDRARRFYSSLGFVPSDDWLEISASEAGFSVNTTG